MKMGKMLIGFIAGVVVIGALWFWWAFETTFTIVGAI